MHIGRSGRPRQAAEWDRSSTMGVTRTGWSWQPDGRDSPMRIPTGDGGTVLIRQFSRALDACRVTVDEVGRSVLP